jgi:hypothetical protein
VFANQGGDAAGSGSHSGHQLALELRTGRQCGGQSLHFEGEFEGLWTDLALPPLAAQAAGDVGGANDGEVLPADLDGRSGNLELDGLLAGGGLPDQAADLSLCAAGLGGENGVQRPADGAVPCGAAAVLGFARARALQDLAGAETAKRVHARGAREVHQPLVGQHNLALTVEDHGQAGQGVENAAQSRHGLQGSPLRLDDDRTRTRGWRKRKDLHGIVHHTTGGLSGGPKVFHPPCRSMA